MFHICSNYKIPLNDEQMMRLPHQDVITSTKGYKEVSQN